jgi:hypothetical protein
LRFASAEVGYAFDPDLVMTTDGGKTWEGQPGRHVAALEPAGGDVMRVGYTHTGCPGPCDVMIERADPGSA